MPYPRDVLAAACRVSDLIHAERYGDARRLADAFRDRPADPAHRLSLLGAALRGAVLMADAEQIDRDTTDMVRLLNRSGHRELAGALVAVLLERGPLHGLHGRAAPADPAGVGPADLADPAGSADAPGPSAPARRGRRRGQQMPPRPEMLALARGLSLTTLPGPGEIRGSEIDPRRTVARLRAALDAVPAVRAQLPGDPETQLRVGLARALELVGDRAAATTQALDALERLEQADADAGGSLPDPLRLATAARTVLARTLGTERPLQGARHALDALAALHEVDDPPLRVGLITHLLQAFMAAGAIDHASLTSGRLASLQRTVQRESLRTGPLLAVAAQRVQAERYDAAWVPLQRARRIARDHRDHRSCLEAARLAASIHERTGDHPAALHELGLLAAEARWLADDLATARPERAQLVSTELSAQALVLRRALDLGRTAMVHEAAAAIEHRARPEGGRPLLPPELLWDHRVDARVARFIAAGEACGRQEEGATLADCDRRRREALQIVDEAPAGHDARARYWAAYIDDRHAQMLADRGKRTAALRAARRARAGWEHLGRADDVARAEVLITQLDEA
ncbi:hypothetical protein ACTXO9_11810 [Brachybacterium tyrofermentans]|uniref:hypothetical protein n=1 Tax=Brachybacterium tyrofermentans TaxID=47848 RepID=UPI003FD3DA4A